MPTDHARILLLSLVSLAILGNGCSGSSLARQPMVAPPADTAARGQTPNTWSPPGDFRIPINRDVAGISCFRGNPQRNYLGEGPIPTGNVQVLWRAPIGRVSSGHWAGVGWTGQPLIVSWPKETRRWMNFLHPPGPEWEVIVGALDGQVHFYDAETGRPSRKPLTMPHPYPIKGTVTLDPRGYPLIFVGCGVDVGVPGYRAFSLLDFRELFCLKAKDPAAPRSWPGSDSNALILRDTLFLPCENGLLYKVGLNSSWNAQTGELSVRPQVTKVRFSKAGMESSMAAWGDYGYVADNVGAIRRFALDDPTQHKVIAQTGDDTDSTCAFDPEGRFYVGREVDKQTGKGATGKLFKIDASTGGVVWEWSFPAGSIPGGNGKNPINGGILSTPAVCPETGMVYVTTCHHPRVGQGFLAAVDMNSGRSRWTVKLRGFAWSSPIVGTISDRESAETGEGSNSRFAVLACDSTGAVFVRDAMTGKSLLTDSAGKVIRCIQLGANVESSPIMWRGRVYVGVRGGALVCLGLRKDK